MYVLGTDLDNCELKIPKHFRLWADNFENTSHEFDL